MNTVVIIGNLTRDPELRSTADQTDVCNFSIAVSDKSGDNERTDYIPITVFGKQARNCDRYLAKGKKAAVLGKIRTGSYVNKEGKKVYTTNVVAQRVEFLSPNEQRQMQGQRYDAQDFGDFLEDDWQQG